MSKPRKRKGMIPQKVRCTAHNRWGEPCKKWAMKGSVVCDKHGGMAPQVRRKAQERILMAQDDAASLLVRFMADKEVPIGERRRCAEFLLNYENRNEVVLTIAKWEQDLGDLFVTYEPTEPSDVVEGELVEDAPRAIPPSDAEWRADNDTDAPPKYGRGSLRGRGQVGRCPSALRLRGRAPPPGVWGLGSARTRLTQVLWSRSPSGARDGLDADSLDDLHLNASRLWGLRSSQTCLAASR